MARNRERAFGGLRQLYSWSLGRWLAAIVIAALTAVLSGVPTGLIRTGFYTRMTPVTWWDWPVWAASAGLVGVLLATYLPDSQPRQSRGVTRGFGGGIGSTLAVGCPICNKIVVALVGVGGALRYWAPVQPILGIAAIGLLAFGLIVRLEGQAACAVPRIATPRRREV